MIDPGLTVRRSRTVVLAFEGPGLVAYDFLARSTAALSPTAVALLANAGDWCHAGALKEGVGRLLEPGPPSGGLDAFLDAELEALLAAGILIAAGSPAAARDAEYERDWEWGLVTGLYHFGSKDQPYMPPEVVPEFLSRRMAESAPVELHLSNAALQPAIDLPSPNGSDRLLELMRRRRSYRGFDEGAPIALRELRDCLRASRSNRTTSRSR